MQWYFSHFCACGLKKKLYLRSSSKRHRHFTGFFNLPVLHRHGITFLYGDCDTPPHLVAFYDTHGIRRTYSRLKPPASSRGGGERSFLDNPLLQITISSDRKDSVTYEMHSSELEVCVKKCCCVLFYSEVISLQGSVNTHRCALLLVPKWECISSFDFTLSENLNIIV